jgi:hypothetical protein
MVAKRVQKTAARSDGKKADQTASQWAAYWVVRSVDHSACWKVVPRVGSKVARWAVL